MLSSSRSQPARWIVWGRSLLALAVVGILLVLGVANIALRAQSHQVEDGVLWTDHAGGVTAEEVADGSPAARAGILRGDVLAEVNGSRIDRRADALEFPVTVASRARRSSVDARPVPRRTPVARRRAGAVAARQLDVFRPRGRGTFHAARRRVRAPAASGRSGDAAFLLALRRVLRRIHVLVHRPARSP